MAVGWAGVYFRVMTCAFFFDPLGCGVCPACISVLHELEPFCSSCISACSGKRPAVYGSWCFVHLFGPPGLDGQASVHEGDRGIDIFGEYNKGS